MGAGARTEVPKQYVGRSTDTERVLTDLSRAAGIDVLGFGNAAPLADARRAIEIRNRAGYFGRMRFAMRTPERSCVPRSTLPSARSIVVAGLRYWSDPPEKPSTLSGRIARYSWRDWYGDLESGLEQLATCLRTLGHEAVVLVDDNRLVDRAAAARASIGYFAKNANIMVGGMGSGLILGSILTSAELSESQIPDDDCGPCNICIRQCPTGAIVEPGVIDARRCIAYLLQAPDDIPREFRSAVGDKIYGCDECQEVCPVNKTAGSRLLAPKVRQSGHPWVDMSELLSSSAETLRSRFARFYMPRRDFDFLRRNALVALGNSRDQTALHSVLPFLSHARPMLRRHAAWALGSLGGLRARAALNSQAAREIDAGVRTEIAAALDQIGS